MTTCIELDVPGERAVRHSPWEQMLSDPKLLKPALYKPSFYFIVTVLSDLILNDGGNISKLYCKRNAKSQRGPSHVFLLVIP